MQLNTRRCSLIFQRTGSKILHVHKVKGLKSHNADKQIRERAVNTSNMYKARLLSAMWWMQTPSDLCGDICFYTCTSVYRRQAESENTHICTGCALHCMHVCWKASLQPERLKECLKCVCDGVGGALLVALCVTATGLCLSLIYCWCSKPIQFDLSLGKQEPGLVQAQSKWFFNNLWDYFGDTAFVNQTTWLNLIWALNHFTFPCSYSPFLLSKCDIFSSGLSLVRCIFTNTTSRAPSLMCNCERWVHCSQCRLISSVYYVLQVQL